MLGWCWADVVDGGPTSTQHWLNALCLFSGRGWCTCHWLGPAICGISSGKSLDTLASGIRCVSFIRKARQNISLHLVLIHKVSHPSSRVTWLTMLTVGRHCSSTGCWNSYWTSNADLCLGQGQVMCRANGLHYTCSLCRCWNIKALQILQIHDR